MATEPEEIETPTSRVILLQSDSLDDASQNEEDTSSSVSASELSKDDSNSSSTNNPTSSKKYEKSSSLSQCKMAEDKSNISASLAPGVDFDIRYDDVGLRGNKNFVDPEVQKCRAQLRERFMWAVTGLNGKSVKVEMMDQLQVSGVLRGVDKDGLMVHVENLKTPTAVHPWATLRLPDCLVLRFQA